MMEIHDSGRDILRPGGKNQGAKRPATFYGDTSSMKGSGTDLRKSFQSEMLSWSLVSEGTPNLTVGSLPENSAKVNMGRRLSLQLEKQLSEVAGYTGKQPVTIGNQTAMIACWNSVHGKPDTDKSPDSEYGSPKETDTAKVAEVVKKPLGRTTSDEIRTALKQQHVQSMKRALTVRRNSASVTVNENNTGKLGMRSMSMFLASAFSSSPKINRSKSVVAANSNLSTEALKGDPVALKRDLASLNGDSSALKGESVALKRDSGAAGGDTQSLQGDTTKIHENWNRAFDENSNEKQSFLKGLEEVADEMTTARQSSYPGAFGALSVDDKRLSMPLSDAYHKQVRFTLTPHADYSEEVNFTF